MGIKTTKTTETAAETNTATETAAAVEAAETAKAAQAAADKAAAAEVATACGLIVDALNVKIEKDSGPNTRSWAAAVKIMDVLGATFKGDGKTLAAKVSDTSDNVSRNLPRVIEVLNRIMAATARVSGNGDRQGNAGIPANRHAAAVFGLSETKASIRDEVKSNRFA